MGVASVVIVASVVAVASVVVEVAVVVVAGVGGARGPSSGSCWGTSKRGSTCPDCCSTSNSKVPESPDVTASKHPSLTSLAVAPASEEPETAATLPPLAPLDVA